MSYTTVKGHIFNITNVFTFINSKSTSNTTNDGANSTVSYLGVNFKNLSYINNGFENIDVYPDDYMIITVKIPKTNSIINNNLFNISPFFFNYTNNNVTTNIFASIDNTIQFFDKIHNVGTTYKICFTSSKTVANKFKDKYIISMFPKDLLSSCTFTLMFRLGIVNSLQYSKNISKFVKCKYYRYSSNIQKYNNLLYFNTSDIVSSFQQALLPPPESYKSVLDIFNSINNYFISLDYVNFTSYKYLSNIYNTNYAIQNYFSAIPVLAQTYGTNTGESYFTCNYINLTAYNNQYLYILALNQNKLGIVLTSNIQIYNSTTLANIINGTIITSPNLPSFISKSYPVITENTLPLYTLTCYSVDNIISSNNLTSIGICERLSYSPINYYHPSNEYKGTVIAFIGSQLTQSQTDYLNQLYSITINTIL